MSRPIANAPRWLAEDRQPGSPAGDRPTASPIARPIARPPAPDHQAGPPVVSHQPSPPTHRIVAPRDRQAVELQDDRQEPQWTGASTTLRGRFAQACDGLRFVHQSPGSLRDQVEYARDGAYTVRAYGWWRTANVVFARLVATPGLTVCYLAAWAFFTRLTRALIAWPILAFLLMFLNSIPFAEMFVPDWADFTNWF